MSRRKNNADDDSRKIKINVDEKRQHNEYYYKVSKRYRTLKFLSLGALILYLIGMLALNRSQITYENLVYLMKDLDTDVDAAGTVFKEIKYDESLKLSGAVYKGYFAAATTGSFTLFNTTGSAEREYSISMENPKVLAGEKYVMVYDVGGNSYSLYTSIVDVLTKQSDQIIQGGALSDSGAFALICRARENRYVVNFYDENFREVSKIYKDKYVMDVSLSPDGSRYMIASCEVSGSDVTCEVMKGRCDSDDEFVTTRIDGAMPLKTGFFSDGSSCVVCDDAVCFFSKDGAKAAEYELTGHGISGVSFAKDKVMVVESDNIVESSNTAAVYDLKGNEITKYHVMTKIAACALGDDNMFFAFDGVLNRIDFEGKSDTAECPLSVSALLPFSDNVLVCTPTRTVTGFLDPDDAGAGTEGAGSDSSGEIVFDPVEG